MALKKNIYKQFSKGFTFVEMMVVIMIMTVLFGGGYSNYRDFSRRKSLESAANQIASDIRLAKEYASAGRKECSDNSTEVLDGYRFSMMVGSDTYTLQSVCSNSSLEVKEAEILNASIAEVWEYAACNVSGSRHAETEFVIKSLGEGLDINANGCIKVLLEQIGTGDMYTIQITQTGVVMVAEGGIADAG